MGMSWRQGRDGQETDGTVLGLGDGLLRNPGRLYIVFVRKLFVWATRKLTLAGWVLVINQLILASMWYVARVGTPLTPCATPSKAWYIITYCQVRKTHVRGPK